MLARITPATKLIAIANPNSPTGQSVGREEILRMTEAAPQAAVLVDEAYFHFHGQTVMDLIGNVPNLIVARTFSKAYGLAGLRLGLLAAAQEQMHWLRRVISPYSVNSLALACLPAALDDQAYIDWYVDEVLAARIEFTAALTASECSIGRLKQTLCSLASAQSTRSSQKPCAIAECWCAIAQTIPAATAAFASPSGPASTPRKACRQWSNP